MSTIGDQLTVLKHKAGFECSWCRTAAENSNYDIPLGWTEIRVLTVVRSNCGGVDCDLKNTTEVKYACPACWERVGTALVSSGAK